MKMDNIPTETKRERIISHVDEYFKNNPDGDIHDCLKTVSSEIRQNEKNINVEKQINWFKEHLFNKCFKLTNQFDTNTQYFKIGDDFEYVCDFEYITPVYESYMCDGLYSININLLGVVDFSSIIKNPYIHYGYDISYILEEISKEEFNKVVDKFNKIKEIQDEIHN